jgi:hypothetical protein
LLYKVKRYHQSKINWEKPDQTNMLMLDKLQEISPVAKNVKQHLLMQKAELMAFIKNRYAMSGDPFELPVCGHCERWASWHDKPPGSAYCWYCGTVTPDPVTVEEWFEKELKIHNIYDALKKQGIDYLGGKPEPVTIGQDEEEPEPKKIIIVSR